MHLEAALAPRGAAWLLRKRSCLIIFALSLLSISESAWLLQKPFTPNSCFQIIMLVINAPFFLLRPLASDFMP